jgi:hypothetical protein
MNNAICLLCIKPNQIWIDFLKNFKEYDIYVSIDDNSILYESEYDNIHYIQKLDDQCINNGFIRATDHGTTHPNIPPLTNHKYRPMALEKALYYFANINTSYENVWIFEDDVFFNNEQTLLNIDIKYTTSDLLCKSNDLNGYIPDIFLNEWWWWLRDNTIKISPPYFASLICCIRLSQNLIFKIKEYANTNKCLFFCEALFPTVCKFHNLSLNTPDEFQNIEFRKDYNLNDINILNVYHPIKDMKNQKYFRDSIPK